MITFGFKNRFSGWIRAAIAVLIGCVMVIKPETSLIFLVKIIAAVMIASGLVTLAYGIANRREGGLTLLIFNTIVDIAIGVLLFIFPEVVASFVIILLGIVLLIFGIFQIAAMVSASAFVPLGFWSFILPVICAGGGVYGVSELFATWKMSRAMREYKIKYPSSSADGRQPDSGIDMSDVKDAEFEKVYEDHK